MFSQSELRISCIDSATLLLPTVTFRGVSPTNQSRGSWSQIIRLFPSSGVCCVLNVASAVKWPWTLKVAVCSRHLSDDWAPLRHKCCEWINQGPEVKWFNLKGFSVLVRIAGVDSCQHCCEAVKLFLWLWARGVHNIFTLLCETDFAGNISPFTFIYLLIAPLFTLCLKTPFSRLCPLWCYKGSRHLSVVSDNTVTCKSCRTEKKNKVHPSCQTLCGLLLRK